MRGVIVAAVVGFVGAGVGPAAHGEGEGDEAGRLAKRFLDRMAANAPVAGTFDIDATFDKARLERDRRAARKWAAANGGATFEFAPTEIHWACDWAWDGVRECLQPLSGNYWESFYNTPEAFLEGMQRGTYNLNKPGKPAAYRPASFYFVVGTLDWPTFFADCRFEIKAAPEGSPPGATALVARSPAFRAELLIDGSSCGLHRAEFFAKDRPMMRLEVDRLARNADGRVFPSEARVTVFRDGTPYQVETLRARVVKFPATGQEVEAAFNMTLPAGTTVFDQTMDRKIVLNQPTAAALVLAGKVPSQPLLSATPPPIPSPPARARKYFWVIGGNIAVLAVIGIVLIARGVLVWRRPSVSR